MNTDQIIQNSKNISLAGTGEEKNKFCTVWAEVKIGLELLQSILKNPIAKAAIGIVIAAGDAVAKETCLQ